MALISTVCTFAQKGVLFKNFNNLKCSLTCIAFDKYNVKRFSASHNVKYFAIKDQTIPMGKTEIYYGILTKQIRVLKAFSLFTSATSLLTQPFLYLKAVENGNTGAVLGIFACMGFLAVITPLLIHIITKRYVTHLYYNAKEDKYIANTYNLFVRTKELVFTPDDVIIPNITGMFTNCVIKGTPLFLEQKLFYDHKHYIRIMGYDKPIDLKLNNNNKTNQTVTINTEYRDDLSKK